jgi:hypothetical protein
MYGKNKETGESVSSSPAAAFEAAATVKAATAQVAPIGSVGSNNAKRKLTQAERRLLYGKKKDPAATAAGDASELPAPTPAYQPAVPAVAVPSAAGGAKRKLTQAERRLLYHKPKPATATATPPEGPKSGDNADSSEAPKTKKSKEKRKQSDGQKKEKKAKKTKTV